MMLLFTAPQRGAREAHHFLSVTKQGLSAIVATRGNPNCHVILRGGKDGPNHDAYNVSRAVELLRQTKLQPNVMVDCSHANSGKDPAVQLVVADSVARQVEAGSRSIIGVMLESFLVAGRQEPADRDLLTFGQSVTDACLGWEDTLPILEHLARAALRRRAK